MIPIQNSELLSGKEIRALIIEKRMAFINRCIYYINYHQLHVFHGTTGIQMRIFQLYSYVNPNYGDELLAVERALGIEVIHQMYWNMQNDDEKVGFIENIHKIYWPKVIKKALKKTGLKDKVEVDYTNLLRESLARGFKVKEDCKLSRKRYKVKVVLSNDITLYWPSNFKTRDDAIEVALKFSPFKYYVLKPIL